MKNKECFVICPLGDEKSDIRKRSDSLYENVFKPAIIKANLSPIRSDESLTPTITPDILNRLRNSSFVFADISGKSSANPNVMYELGYREAFGLPSIIVRDENSTIPFDIKDKRIITISKRSEEHTSELQSHSFISYAVFCLKKKKLIYYPVFCFKKLMFSIHHTYDTGATRTVST